MAAGLTQARELCTVVAPLALQRYTDTSTHCAEVCEEGRPTASAAVCRAHAERGLTNYCNRALGHKTVVELGPANREAMWS